MGGDVNHPILDAIRAKGALTRCHQCDGTEFTYVGHSTGASLYVEPSELSPAEVFPQTRSYKLHIVGCLRCHYLLTFFDIK
jgi:hypothetical protein